MIDLFDNEICIGDKVIFPVAYYKRKELDYGIIESMSKDKKSCYCKSLRYKFPAVLRKSYQIVKVS